MAMHGSSVCYLIFLLPYHTAVSYARVYGQNAHLMIFHMIRRQHQTRAHIRYHEYHVPGYQVLYSSSTAAAAVYSRYPDRTRTNKKVTPLESSHRHHRPGRAATARAARERCFDPKRAATAPRFGARSGSRVHRFGSLVGQDQTQPYSNGSRGGTHYHTWP